MSVCKKLAWLIKPRIWQVGKPFPPDFVTTWLLKALFTYGGLAISTLLLLGLFLYTRIDMENSLSSSPETTVPGCKFIFKKPTDHHQAFEVSMEESITVTQGNKSDEGLDVTATTINELVPFKKSRKSIPHAFNVTAGESPINNNSEDSATFTQPQPVFSRQNKSLEDYFNVSFNETNSQAITQDKSIDVDESITTYNKKNPFKKTSETLNEITMRLELSSQTSHNEGNENDALDPPEEKQRSLNSCNDDEEETDTTMFATKSNPFKKSLRPENASVSKISLTELSSINDNEKENNPEMSDSEVSVFQTKENPFTKKKSIENDESMSITKIRSVKSPETNDLQLNEPIENSQQLSLSRSVSKLNSNATYLEQSSINDDNLNNWMSDQTDDDIAPPPRVPSVTCRLSNTKERPAPMDTSATEPEPVNMWEKKMNEIVSNAEKKWSALKLNTKSFSTKPAKKPKVNIPRPVPQNESFENRYRPPKLIKPASFATKQLYRYVIKKLEPKYGIDTNIESEKLISLMCDTVKKVTQRKTHQKNLIQKLKKEMAKAGLIETTMDFHEFIIKFLPYSFRVKVVPCLQPVTNVVYPPKDVLNPFDKIL